LDIFLSNSMTLVDFFLVYVFSFSLCLYPEYFSWKHLTKIDDSWAMIENIICFLWMPLLTTISIFPLQGFWWIAQVFFHLFTMVIPSSWMNFLWILWSIFYLRFFKPTPLHLFLFFNAIWTQIMMMTLFNSIKRLLVDINPILYIVGKS
jgi:hypothetical protein